MQKKPRNVYASARRKRKTGASIFRKLFLNKNSAGQTPVWRLILIDFLVFGIALLVFAYFHHVMPRSEKVVGTTSARVSARQEATVQATATPSPTPEIIESGSAAEAMSASPTPEATPSPSPSPSPSPTPDPIGYFGTKYADMFTDGKVISTGTSYQSANLNVTASQLHENGSDIYFVDVYVRDISCFRTEFANGTFGRSVSEWATSVASRIGSVVCISGDYYGGRSSGVVIRNGLLYRDNDTTNDVGVLYWDGTMKCFSPNEFDAETEMVNGAYQAWNFGPMLLDTDGNAMTNFNSTVGKRNPRAAIGYFEPGHYCLVVVDGRSDASVGLSLEDLSAFFERVGCKAAYNLDGGATAQMVCGTQLVNNPSGGGRKCSDFVVIMDEIITGF